MNVIARLRRSAWQLGVAAVVVAAAWGLGRSGLFEWAVAEVAALGVWALPAFFLIHVASGILFVPSPIPNLAAGVLFGVSQGLLVSLAGLAVGATISFVIGRALGRDWLHRRFAADSRFHGLIRLVGQRGWKIIVLARLSPIFPFSVANYAFGLTTMRATTYGLASLVGSIPSTLVFVSLGAAAGGLGEAATPEGRTPAEWALLAVGIVAMGALAFVVRRIAIEAFAELRELERELDAESPEDVDEAEAPLV